MEVRPMDLAPPGDGPEASLALAQQLWTVRSKVDPRLCWLLRELFDGQRHKHDGYARFGEWCEHRFPGMGASQANHMSRAGLVYMTLATSGRIRWSGELGPDRGVPGGETVRILATALLKKGPETMLEMYDLANHLAAQNGWPVGAPVIKRHVVAAGEAMLIAHNVPQDPPKPRKPKPDPELELPEPTEEWENLMDALGLVYELEEKIQALVENEGSLFLSLVSGQFSHVTALAEDLRGAAADVALNLREYEAKQRAALEAPVGEALEPS